MLRNASVALVLSVIGLTLLPSAAWAADAFAGKYKGSTLSVELTPDGDAFAGTIQLGARKFPLKAHNENGTLTGTFNSNGSDFSFSATLSGDTLTLNTGGATYTLKKDTPPVNPLGAAAGNPLAAGAADAPAGYTVVNTTANGKSLTAQKPDATTVMAAMKSTFPDLERYFGSRPSILGAYENARDHKSGTATFAVTSNGKPLKGLVSCKIGDKGATVAVVYCTADAPPAEWAKLTTATAPPVDTAAAATPQPALAPWTEYTFPDGTGSIGLAEGWTTQAQSCMSCVQIKGPADQTVTIGLCFPVQTPDSPLVQMHNQLVANARQMGMQPPQEMKMLVAPYTGPVDAMNNLLPQLSKFSEASGSFALEMDGLTELPQKVDPSLPSGKAALLTYGVTHIQNGTRTHFLGGARVETTPVGNGAWMFYMTEIAAPDKSFKGDTPLMLAMINSLKPNNQVIAEKTRQNLDASNRRFAEMQQAHKEQMAGYDAQNKAWEQRELVQSRSNADFDEIIRGDRTVLDTQTGDRTSVDLGNVDRIVDHLNETDPGRYKQIPLRDELYPLPAEPGR
jgi:hypothetical protein